MLEVKQLVKRYGNNLAVSDISFSVAKGGLWPPWPKRRRQVQHHQHHHRPHQKRCRHGEEWEALTWTKT